MFGQRPDDAVDMRTAAAAPDLRELSVHGAALRARGVREG